MSKVLDIAIILVNLLTLKILFFPKKKGEPRPFKSIS